MILGCWLFALGLALKIGIADPMALLVERTYSNLAAHGLGSIYVGTLGFAVQIFCDFAGYSLMARGLALLLGFTLSVNFRQPYFAASFSDFWRRWHITLSTWIRDYIYIPLGGSRGSLLRTSAYILIAMALCGLWHGASYAFVLWGVLHGALLATERWGRVLLGNRIMPRSLQVLYGVIVFHGVLAGWFLFRIGDLISLDSAVRTLSLGRPWLAGFTPDWATLWPFAAFVLFLVLHELKAWRTDRDVLPWQLAPAHRTALYALVLVLILSSGGSVNVPFIYFQF
jgi:D-alanyl-lipoteichoic acid acyltransferase DltB (MBOAT superfamily)